MPSICFNLVPFLMSNYSSWMKITAERLTLFKKPWYNFTFKMSPRRTIPSLIVSEGLFAVLLVLISSRDPLPPSMLKSFRQKKKKSEMNVKRNRTN